MAFTNTNELDTIMGNKRIKGGTVAQGKGNKGGTIVTGLSVVDNFQCTIPCVNVSEKGGLVTITTADPQKAQAGYWMAIGT